MYMTTALRSLRRAPAFTALVVLILAIGIAATTAMFSVVDAGILRPLPYQNVDRLEELWVAQADGSRRPGIPGPGLVALQDRTDLFSSVEIYQFGSTVVTGGAEPSAVASPSISPGLLQTLGVVPVLGRLFTGDDLVAARRVVLISERFWATQFGSDPSVVGRTVFLDDQPQEVIGVLPRGFRFPEANVAIWRPLDVRAAAASKQRFLAVAVRPTGISAEQLIPRLPSVNARLVAVGAIREGQNLVTDTLLQVKFGRQNGGVLFGLFGVVALVLVVACVNVANLLLVRASVRHNELALRSALGAPGSALARLMFTEGMLLATGASVVGLALAEAFLAVVAAIVPAQLTFMATAPLELEWRALGFALGVSSLTCFAFCLLPAWRAACTDSMDSLQSGGRSIAGAYHERWQGLLLVAQLAIVLIVLACGGLLLRSFGRLLNVDPGFQPDGLVVLDVEYSRSRYGAGTALSAIQEIEKRLEARGNLEAAVSSGMQAARSLTPEAEGVPPFGAGELPALPWTEVGPDFFAAMQVPIRAGRTFREDDPPDVVVVSESLARRFWGRLDPVGSRIRVNSDQPWLTVVGVAGDIAKAGLEPQAGLGMEFYLPHPINKAGGRYSLIVRTAADPQVAIQAAKEQIWLLDNRIPITEATTMHARLGERIAQPLFLLRLTLAFALIAVLLASVGTYGVAAYWVARRRRELGLRIALGATRQQVIALVITRTVRLAIGGAALGLAVAYAASRAIESLLFDTPARDPLILTAVTIALILIAVVASALPAFKASNADAFSALRSE